LSNSATVRPSIGESAEFAELFPPRSPVFAFQRTVPNLHIPKADVRVASAERDLSTAFSSALANPDEFGVIMAKAVHDAK